MGTSSPNRYDQIPYLSRPEPDSHPNHLAAQAVLMGLQPTPVERCRVLELGCAQAGNLLPMAVSFPEAQFVGMDASAVEIGQGLEIRDALGLANLDLRHASFEDVDESWGLFDYIICHGVYSWVGPEAQAGIMAICKANLAPQGVAYISYNLLPGWYQRLPLRELMIHQTQSLTSSEEQIAAARGALSFLARSVPFSEGIFRQLAEAYDDYLAGHLDTYIFHEYLSPVNEPIYFIEFLQRAWAHGLQYLSESEFHSMVPENVSDAVAEELRGAVTDLITTEQVLDFVRNRAFRKTLLVHHELSPNRDILVGVLAGLRISGKLQPVGVGEVDGQLSLPFERRAGKHPVIAFEGLSGGAFDADTPLSQAALLLLWEHRPNSFSFDELLERSCAKIGRAEEPSDEDRLDLGQTLLAVYSGDLVRLRLSSEAFRAQVSACPRACRLARFQAARGLEVSSRVHRNVHLEDLDLTLLEQLDGTRSLDQLVEIMTRKIQLGVLELGPGWRDHPDLAEWLGQHLPVRLTLMGQLGLLVG